MLPPSSMAPSHLSFQFCSFFIFIVIHVSKPTISTPASNENVYIIHMDPSAMPQPFSSKTSWYMSHLESISNAKTPASVQNAKYIYTYHHVVDGFSARLSPSELNSIQSFPGFVSARKDSRARLHTSRSWEFIGLSPDTGAWPAANFGHGIIIGVIDTGVWPESKSFSDDGMDVIPSKWKGKCQFGQEFDSSLCNKKLIGAQYFNKGFVANQPNFTISVNSTRDTIGHGTHTSSTAAGNFVDGASFFGYAPGTIRGTAPRAHVAVYKVGWTEEVYESDLIAAVDQAIEDGVDIISLSLGFPVSALYDDPVAIATFRAVAKGIFVSASAGNDGAEDGQVSNGTPWLVTVAAGTVDRRFFGTLTLGNGISVNAVTLYPGEYPTYPIPMVFMNLCYDLERPEIMGNKVVVVCEERNGSLQDMYYNVGAANVTGGVFITNISSELDDYLERSFPAMFVNREDGQKIKQFIKQTKIGATAKMEFGKTTTGEKPAPMVTDYSSRGPSLMCPFVMKPDVVAPGDFILASWPDNKPTIVDPFVSGFFSKFNIISGTSMSAPHVAGVAALIRAVHLDWSPSAIRSAIMTTANITDNTGSPILQVGFDYVVSPATPLAMGSGHVNPNKALNPGLVYNTTTQDYINLLCGLNLTQEQIKIITGQSLCNCSSGSLDLNYPSFIAYFDFNRTGLPNSFKVKEFKRTVTNVDEGPVLYTAEVTPITGFNISVAPEKLYFNRKLETKSFRVRIQGSKIGQGDKAFSYLTWKESSGKYVVRSPIVVTSTNILSEN